MPRQKFSDYDLGERLRQGKNVQSIAAEFGVSVQSVYKRAKRYKLNISKDVAFNQAAAVNQHVIDWSGQLLKINEAGNRWLDNLERLLESRQGETTAEIVADLEPLRGELSAAAAELHLDPLVARLEKLVVYDLEVLDRLPRFIAEIRQQLKLLMDAWKTKYDAEQIAHMQRLLLDEIGQESPELRQRIVARIRAVQSLEFPGWDLSPAERGRR